MTSTASEKYEVVVGLEVHAQLSTQTKLFCGCKQSFGAGPNQQTCEICLGMPGTLPVVNAQAILLASRAAMALGLTVHKDSLWARKNYFYPDLPKGYQITQDKYPIATGGSLSFLHGDDTIKVRILRVHVEEDAGKNVHDDMLAGNRSWVDFNRGGTPLIEIVSEPDLRSSEAAAEYMRTLRQVLRYLDVCDGNMEQGSLRCDANVSLRPKGQEKLGTRVELKNINSFRFVQQAIDYEVARQAALLDQGQSIVQETRLWDTQAKESRSMRSKEDAVDYRYFPEPDLPPLSLTDAFLARVKQELPELPEQKRERFCEQLGLSSYDAKILTDDRDVAALFEDGVAAAPKNPKAVANWVINEVLRERKGDEALTLKGRAIGELVLLIDNGTISGKMAKDVFVDMVASGKSPEEIVKEKGLAQQNDTAAIDAWVQEIIAAHPDVVEKVREGKRNGIGFLVGQVIKKSRGSANPKIVSNLVTKAIG